MEAVIPVEAVYDRKGNAIYKRYEKRRLTREQVDAICALLVEIYKQNMEELKSLG